MKQPPKPLVVAALGARGSGKSAWVKQHQAVTGATRLVVWDLMREYSGHGQATQSLSAAIKAMASPAWRITYQPNPANKEAEFDLLCKAVKAAKKCTLVAEELAFVTQPNKAPPAWRELCLLGRHETHARATIIGISQRPASIDKDFLACCDVIHCGRMAYDADAKAVAPYLGIDWRELTQLPDLAFVEKSAGQAQAVRGVLSFGTVATNTVTKNTATPPKRHGNSRPQKSP